MYFNFINQSIFKNNLFTFGRKNESKREKILRIKWFYEICVGQKKCTCTHTCTCVCVCDMPKQNKIPMIADNENLQESI